MAVEPAASTGLADQARKLVHEQSYRFDRKFGPGWINTFPRLFLKISKKAQSALSNVHAAVELLERAEQAHSAGDFGEAEQLFGQALEKAQAAEKDGKAYDNLRSWLRECLWTNTSMFAFSTGLQLYYRHLKANGGKPWDETGNWWGEVRQFVAMNVWYMTTVVAAMGGDFDIRRKGDHEARNAFLAELFILWAVLAGTFGGDQLLRKKFNIDPADTRIYTASLVGLLAGLGSNLAQSPNMRGCSPAVAAARGAGSGPARYAISKRLLKWVLDSVPAPTPKLA
jgi:hypothetical protein